jgi:hypothetical protein
MDSGSLPEFLVMKCHWSLATCYWSLVTGH